MRPSREPGPLKVVRCKTLATTGELPRGSPVISDTGWTAGGARIPFREAWEQLEGPLDGDSVSELPMKRGAKGTLKEGELVIMALDQRRG